MGYRKTNLNLRRQKKDILGLAIQNSTLSYDVESGSEITPCNKICKPLEVYHLVLPRVAIV